MTTVLLKSASKAFGVDMKNPAAMLKIFSILLLQVRADFLWSSLMLMEGSGP